MAITSFFFFFYYNVQIVRRTWLFKLAIATDLEEKLCIQHYVVCSKSIESEYWMNLYFQLLNMKW